MLNPLLTAALFIFLSEVVDKTQLVILALGLATRKPVQVFLGALSAHALMDAFAIIIGAKLGTVLPLDIVAFVIGVLFILLGLVTLIKAFREPMTAARPKKGPAFFTAFLLILVSEFGDKTQITAGLLGAAYGRFALVFAGTMLALALAIGLNVFLGRLVAKRIPRKAVNIATGILFVLFGFLSFRILLLPMT